MAAPSSSRGHSSPAVQVQGLDTSLAPEALPRLQAMAEAALHRIEAQFHVAHLTLHYKAHHLKPSGGGKHSVTAHLATDDGVLTANAVEWDVFAATERVLRELQRRARDHRLRRIDMRRDESRAGRRGQAP